MLLPVLGVKLRSVSDDEDWRLHGLEGEKGGGEEEEKGRALKGVGGPEDGRRSSPNTGLPGEHHTYTLTSVTTSPSECVCMCALWEWFNVVNKWKWDCLNV